MLAKRVSIQERMILRMHGRNVVEVRDVVRIWEWDSCSVIVKRTYYGCCSLSLLVMIVRVRWSGRG
jgi:hypothetical protein